MFFADIQQGNVYKKAEVAGIGIFWTNATDIGDYIPLSVIGKTVFLTIEAAEAAIKGESHESI